MLYIPQEILDIIIGYATAGSPERYLSSISHTFHQIALPYKFKSLTFQNRSREGSPDVPIPKFCEAINAGDTHALSLVPLVQELSLLMWGGIPNLSDHFLQEPFKKIINSVLSFRNLTKLTMRNCVTSPTSMEQLGKLVQLQSLHTWLCRVEEYTFGNKVSYDALSNLQSLHTLGCDADSNYFGSQLACISMKNLQILKSGDKAVTEALLSTDPPVQLKELYFTYIYDVDYSLLWNYLARVTSLTHLSLPDLRPPVPDSIPSLVFSHPELQYLHIHVGLAPHFADQPMKEMEIVTESGPSHLIIAEVRQCWQGIVFPHVEHLKTDRVSWGTDKIPIEFWREFLLNVKTVQLPGIH